LSRHLIIPDPHAHPDHGNERFDILGRFIADAKPDHVICLGDLGDMPSLSSYDRGRRSFEGRRYQSDLEAVHDALERIRTPIVARKKKLPTFWWLEGNHEERIRRVGDVDPHLYGTVSHSDLLHKEFGWEYIPYSGSAPGHLVLDGVFYAHYVTSGAMGRPVSGVNHARNILTKKGVSTTVGHSHYRDFSSQTRLDGLHINALVAGCFFDYDMTYVGKEANDAYWRGITLKDEVENGQYDHAWVSLSTLRKAYGG
jgi:hypothetical protein